MNVRPIDAVALTEGLELHRKGTDQEYEADRQWAVGYNAGLDRALYLIAYAKTVAPPPNGPLTPEGGYSHEIVHCKDCVNLYFKDFSAFCPHRVSACRPEGFCEYGERRKPEAGS